VRGPGRRRLLTLAAVFSLLCALAAACGDPSGVGRAAADAAPEADIADATGDLPPEQPVLRDLVALVDPFIGTAGAGHAIPGALVPHGAVRASPVTFAAAGPVTAYDHGADTLYGFSHTHLEGAGGSRNGYSQILLAATGETLDFATNEGGDAVAAFSSRLDHTAESARPGYYRVELAENLVTVELAATQWAALHRYTFAGGATPQVMLRLGHSLGDPKGGRATRIDARTLEGYADYDVHPVVSQTLRDGTTGRVRIYYSLRFDDDIAALRLWNEGVSAPALGATEATGSRVVAVAGFSAAGAGEERVVHARLGLSLIDEVQARRNADAQIGEERLETIAARAADAWNQRLNRVQLDGGSEAQRTTFYTALYHAMFQPADYTEEGGRFVTAAAGTPEVFEADGWRYYTDDWCLWDTYRTSAPLRTLFEPDLVDDDVRSLLHYYEQGGWLPKCPWHAAGYSRVMTGNPAIAIIADAVVKGFDGFDTALAVEAAVALSSDDDNPFPAGLCGYFGLGTPREYIEDGYVPSECDPTQAASLTLELAYADWALAQMAAHLGEDDIAEQFAARAQSYRAHWDADEGFMRGRRRDGSWVSPFDPADRGDFNEFVEASAWIFTFFVPHDVPGLIELIGGPAAFVAKLDAFFAGGHFDPSNQPSFHIPWLYNYAGRPDRTQERVRAVLESSYAPTPGGLPGNDDAGSTSAWYVLSALGLYPVAPGEARYELAAPLFPRAELFAGTGRFTIETRGATGGRYIEAVTLDGAPLDRTWIGHDELVAGGTLVFTLSDEPGPWQMRAE
jgi:predicted alpha-1,2-mannosidase